jgi:co-chaperonin GroES (HSP10)
MKPRAIGCRVLIQPEIVKEVTRGGIYKPQEAREREQAAAVRGAVLDIGPKCSPDYIEGVKIGDRVFYARYAGFRTDQDDPNSPILVSDSDLCGVDDEPEQVHIGVDPAAGESTSVAAIRFSDGSFKPLEKTSTGERW